MNNFDNVKNTLLSNYHDKEFLEYHKYCTYFNIKPSSAKSLQAFNIMRCYW